MAEERRGRRPAQGSTGRASGGSSAGKRTFGKDGGPKKAAGRPARAGDGPRKRVEGETPRKRPDGETPRRRPEGETPRRRPDGEAPRKRTERAPRAEGAERRTPGTRPAANRSGGARPAGGRGGAQRPPRVVEQRTEEQKAYDGPDLPEGISGKELDRSIAMQLKGLPEKLAARIAKHLVAAGMFIDTEPELAYQHAKAAKSRAQRIAVVREALGEAAYAAGHYAEALAELRAAKRMNGATAYLPIMADCHRALGQPEQAIKLAQNPSVVGFTTEAKTEMTLVEAGARRDMGQLDAALRTLELAPLNSKSRGAWVVRLRYAYADTLEEAGRLSDALAWFHRTFAIDADELTDAAERAEQLEARVDRED